MNSYKIIYPYQSNITHLADNEYEAFDKAYDEYAKSNNKSQIFVVLNTLTYTPYYLEMKQKNNQSFGGNRNGGSNGNRNGDLDDDSNGDKNNVINMNMNNDFDNGKKDQNDLNNNNFEDNVVKNIDLDNNNINLIMKKNELLEMKINRLEFELTKTKFKVDHLINQYSHPNAHNEHNAYNSHGTRQTTHDNRSIKQQKDQSNKKEEDDCIIM